MKRIPLQRIGVPTGLVSKLDHRNDLTRIRNLGFGTVEIHEDAHFLLDDSLDIMPSVSIHASSDSKDFVRMAINLGIQRIVIHPDCIDSDPLWLEAGEKLLIENLDPTNPLWRSAKDIRTALIKVPMANICLDIAHIAMDDSLATEFVIEFAHKIKQIHFSEINPYTGEHYSSMSAIALAQSKWIHELPSDIPIILELKENTPWESVEFIVSYLS